MDFAALVLVGFGVYQAKNKGRESLFEGLLVLFLILCLASIGLISQIYHTGGQLYQALLIWACNTAGLAFHSRKLFAPFVWAGGLLVGICFAALDSLYLESEFHQSKASILMTLTLFSFLISALGKYSNGGENHSYCFGVYAIILGVFALVFADGGLNTLEFGFLGVRPFIPAYVLALIISLGIWHLQLYTKMQRTLQLLGLAIFFVPFHLPVFQIHSEVIHAVLTLLMLLCLALFQASLGKRKMFQFFVILIGLRLLMLYFQTLGPLATTGGGLIASGILIIATMVFWSKNRDRLVNWSEDFTR